MSMTLNTKRWEGFLRALDQESVKEFRKGFRQSANVLKKRFQADWSGGALRRRTGRSAKSFRVSVISTRGLLRGRPITASVFSRYFAVRFHERGYDLYKGKKGRGGTFIRHIPGKHIVERRTEAYSDEHKRHMENTMVTLIRRATGKP